jgi:hypothetical protein
VKYQIAKKINGMIKKTKNKTGYPRLSKDLKAPAILIEPPIIMVISSDIMRGGCKANGIIPVTPSMVMITRQARTVKPPTAKAGLYPLL